MQDIILTNKYSHDGDILEAKQIWVYEVLVALGAEENILAEEENDFVKQHLSTLGIEVWNKVDEVDILRNDKLVAQWKKPKLIVKTDKDGQYYEIHLKQWALPFQMNRRKNE